MNPDGRTVTEESADLPESRSKPRIDWISKVAALLARIGADSRDDEELRQKKSLLVMIAILIAPISVVWGTLYLALGSAVGIAPLVYCTVSVASLLVFAKTKSFRFLLNVQLVNILIAPTAGGLMLVGGFLPSGAVGLWGILAPLGALVFLEVRQAVRWFVAFLVVFLVTGVAGEMLFSDIDLPAEFTSTMLALNVIGAGSVAFTLLALFAKQRNLALTALRIEQEKSEDLLLRVLPRPIAERLKGAPHTIADQFVAASILFADVVDFTPFAERLPPAEVVGFLDHIFAEFDASVERNGLEKVKTIGDCYMAVAGVPNPSPDHARKAALLALDMRDVVATSVMAGRPSFELRIGINSGPVVGGVIGAKRFLYDLWGDAVNTASRMESHGTPGEIQITRATYDLLKDEFVCKRRGTIPVKGKGRMETWYLVGRRTDDGQTDRGALQEEQDPLRSDAAGIIEHMNTDHVDALLTLAQAQEDEDVVNATMTAVDRYGMDVLINTDVGERAIRITFTKDVRSAEAARVEIISLLTKARKKLGITRVARGKGIA